LAVRIHITPGLFPRQRSSVAWNADASDLRTCINAIEKRFPGARRSLIDERGRVRGQIQIYVDGDSAQTEARLLRGDEQIVIETAQTASTARAHAISRFRRRTNADLEYERRYGPIKMEGACSGGLGESLAFTGIGTALLAWLGGSLAFGGASIGIPVVLGGITGVLLVVWGLYNLYDDLFA